MSFEHALKQALAQNSYSVTENGAVGYASTAHHLLDLHFAISSMRNEYTRKGMLNEHLVKAFEESPADFMAWLFYIRDIRQGIGERTLFRDIISRISSDPELLKESHLTEMLPLVPEFGRWDDLFFIKDEELYNAVMQSLAVILFEDYEIALGQREGDITLLAKWMPSVKTHSEYSMALARDFCRINKIKQKDYRKILSTLRKKLDIVEVKMSANEFDKIKYSAVPSRAAMIYSDAFRRHDEERYSEYKQNVIEGKEKVNVGTLFPHELAYKLREPRQDVAFIDAAWNQLPKLDLKKGYIPIIDTSGSMYSPVPGTKSVSCVDVSVGLGIYLAQNNPSEAFKDTVISFSATPEFLDISGKTLSESANYIWDKCQGLNTNLFLVFVQLLNAAIESNTPKDGIPNVIVISDMEFDETTTNNGWYKPSINPTLMAKVKQMYANAGYDLPRCVWWNICSRTMTIPQVNSEYGVVLMSGFSQNALKMIESESLDPYQVLIDTLRVDRYKPIYNIFGIQL